MRARMSGGHWALILCGLDKVRRPRKSADAKLRRFPRGDHRTIIRPFAFVAYGLWCAVWR
eukprot:826065-Prymnesium_polylepis.1